MPIYEYKCTKCGKEFEVFQGITDPEVTTCKFCEGRVHKLVSLSSFHLKGSGWYVTDYGGKKPSTSEAVKAEEKAAVEAGKKAPIASTSDTKSDD